MVRCLENIRPGSNNVDQIIGFSDENYEKYQQLIEKPNGIILVTGPTGSGNHYPYATLNILNW